MTVANAKPDLWVTGPLGMSVVNAASSLFSAFTSVEAKITAAYSYAALVGAKYVYIPSSFEGFDATQVTTQAGITPLTEDQLFGNAAIVINPASFAGATGGQKLLAAAAAVPVAGGIVDARSLTGAQTVDVDILFNVASERPIKFIFGPSTWTYTGPNGGYVANLFGSKIIFEGHGTTLKLGDGVNQLNMFGSDQTAGVSTASVTAGSNSITLAGALSRGVLLTPGKVIAILGHLPNGGARDNTTLNGAIDNVTTTIVLTAYAGQMTAAVSPTGYIRVDNEIISYPTAGVSGNTITGATRGAFGTTAASHLTAAAVDRVVYDNYMIQTVTGLVATLDRVVNAANVPPTMTAAPVLVGPADCAFTGQWIFDGARVGTASVKGQCIRAWAAARLKTSRECVFQHWDHVGVMLFQSQFCSIDGTFFDIGTPSVALGWSVNFFCGSKNNAAYGDYWRVNVGPATDARTTNAQHYDNITEGNCFLPRTIRDVAYGFKFHDSSRTSAWVPEVINWGVDGSTGGAFLVDATQWITNPSGALGNQADVGYITPTGTVAAIAAGLGNNYITLRTPACTVTNSGGTTNVITTVEPVAGVNYGLKFASGIFIGGASTLQSLTGAVSVLSGISPDAGVQLNVSSQNSGTAAVPGRVGTQTNHQFGFLTNGLVRAQFDTSGNLVADTTNGGAFQDRLGSAAAVAKHVRIPFQASGLTTTSTSDASVSSFSLPASALAVNGQAVRLTMRGSAVTQAGVPNIKFGATVIATGTITAANVYEIDAIVTRTGAATQISVATIDNGTALSVNSRTTPAETLSGAITIDFRGSVTAGGTLNVDYVQVEYMAS